MQLVFACHDFGLNKTGGSGDGGGGLFELSYRRVKHAAFTENI